MQNVYSNPGPGQITRPDSEKIYILGVGNRPCIRVAQVTATWFGGNQDSGDDGSTASGVFTRDHPWILGCALPYRKSRATPAPFFAGLAAGTLVRVDRLDSEHSAWMPLVDNGPANDNPAGSSIDLTLGSWAALGGIVVGGTPTRGSIPVSFCVFPDVTFWAWASYRTLYSLHG